MEVEDCRCLIRVLLLLIMSSSCDTLFFISWLLLIERRRFRCCFCFSCSWRRYWFGGDFEILSMVVEFLILKLYGWLEIDAIEPLSVLCPICGYLTFRYPNLFCFKIYFKPASSSLEKLMLSASAIYL